MKIIYTIVSNSHHISGTFSSLKKANRWIDNRIEKEAKLTGLHPVKLDRSINSYLGEIRAVEMEEGGQPTKYQIIATTLN